MNINTLAAVLSKLKEDQSFSQYSINYWHFFILLAFRDSVNTYYFPSKNSSWPKKFFKQWFISRLYRNLGHSDKKNIHLQDKATNSKTTDPYPNLKDNKKVGKNN